jgi:mono/diheme cytochrome c family protein
MWGRRGHFYSGMTLSHIRLGNRYSRMANFRLANFHLIGKRARTGFCIAVTDVFQYLLNANRSWRLLRFRRSISPRLPVLLIVAVALFSASACHLDQARAGAGRRLDFNQDVQPILASRCFACHGPDPHMRKAGLRLDLAEWAMKKRPGHPDAIVPGYPEKSELLKRIESKDPHYLKPQSPQGEAKPMRPEEIATLKGWIKEGAVYRPHWAFEAPVRPSVPAVGTAEIDVPSPGEECRLRRLLPSSMKDIA